MNKKAGVSKVLNAKHVKILEGLLKLPENRVCADCKNIGPRWASINLGIFICLQCSGVHRSFGVHISKVRSATLDTWLPEQVAFMQRMGNEKSNAYYEAELPVHFDRGRFENFIRSKYVDRMWVSKDGKVLASPPSSSSISSNSVTDSIANQHLETKERSFVENQGSFREELPSAKTDLTTEQHLEKNDCTLVRNPEVHKDAVEDHTPKVGSEKDLQKTRAVALKDKSIAVARPPKVDYATELFRMLCVDDSAESDSSPSSDTSAWVDFDTDEEETIQGKIAHPSSTGKVHPEPKIDDVKTSLVTETKGFSQEHRKDARDHNQGHRDEHIKSSATSSLHPEQFAVRSQDVSTTADATGISYRGSQTSLQHIHQQHVNSSRSSSENGRTSIILSPGTQLQTLNIPQAKFAANTPPYTAPSLYRPAVQLNGAPTTPVKRPQTPLPVSGYDYDFSFLTQGMFTK